MNHHRIAQRLYEHAYLMRVCPKNERHLKQIAEKQRPEDKGMRIQQFALDVARK